MFSDGYTMEKILDGHAFEVKALEVTIGGEIVVNLVSQHNLQEFILDKKTYMETIKVFLQRAVAHMMENGKEEEVKAFRAKATEFVKFVVSSFDKFTFYTGSSGDKTGHIAHCYQKDEDDLLTKTFSFLNVALSEEKVE